MEMGPNEIRLYIQLIYGLVTPIIIIRRRSTSDGDGGRGCVR